jgi:hypothetical protein
VEGTTSHHEVLRARKHGAAVATRLGADENMILVDQGNQGVLPRRMQDARRSRRRQIHHRPWGVRFPCRVVEGGGGNEDKCRNDSFHST